MLPGRRGNAGKHCRLLDLLGQIYQTLLSEAGFSLLRGLLSSLAVGARAEWMLPMGCGRGSFDSVRSERWAWPAGAMGGNLSCQETVTNADLGSLSLRMRSVTEDQVANKSARMQQGARCTLGLSCLRLGVAVRV